jgi:hypothetical protein
MQMESELVWTVVEASPAGDTVVGVYTLLGRAREAVSLLAAEGTLEDYRIEGHVLDSGKEADIPWQVRLARGGEHLDTSPFTGCSCADDEAEFHRRSFIERDGEAMSVIVFAPTPGRAIGAAETLREWLLQQDLWAPGRQLEPIQAGRTTV